MIGAGSIVVLSLLGLLTGAHAQSLVELTAQNFVQAAQMPVSWLIHVEQLSNPQSAKAAAVLKPALAQAVQYYNGPTAQHKGVRVAHCDIQQQPRLRQ